MTAKLSTMKSRMFILSGILLLATVLGLIGQPLPLIPFLFLAAIEIWAVYPLATWLQETVRNRILHSFSVPKS